MEELTEYTSEIDYVERDPEELAVRYASFLHRLVNSHIPHSDAVKMTRDLIKAEQTLPAFPSGMLPEIIQDS